MLFSGKLISVRLIKQLTHILIQNYDREMLASGDIKSYVIFANQG